MVPFNRHFSEQQQDRGLKARLQKQDNISGIFNWCLEGFRAMAAEGKLRIPEKVKKDIEKYRQSNDRIGEFLDECFCSHVDGATHREKLSKVYKLDVYKRQKLCNAFLAKLNRMPSGHEISRYLGISIKQARQLQNDAGMALSLIHI